MNNFLVTESNLCLDLKKNMLSPISILQPILKAVCKSAVFALVGIIFIALRISICSSLHHFATFFNPEPRLLGVTVAANGVLSDA